MRAQSKLEAKLAFVANFVYVNFALHMINK